MIGNEPFTLEYAKMAEPKSDMALVRELLSRRYTGTPLACVQSYGCQQSVADGEKFMGLLGQMGYGFTDQQENADFILYNTCAVRETAQQRVLGKVGELKHCKERRPGMVIAIAGCMTQQQQVANKIRDSYPYVDIVVGTNPFAQLPRLIYEKLSANRRFVKEGDSLQNAPIVEGLPTRRDGVTKAWVPVMYGCDNFCSYCIVPYVRGRERSRESASIVAEIKELVASGCREIILLGQNVNSYGKGLAETINFAQLLRKINALDGDFLIRFMTSHPKDCTRELLDAMAECGKVARHLHLPVQSGSDRILAAMNRRYTTQQYLELTQYARAKMPDITLTSDIIVGFPGETREDFLETLALVDQVRYTQIYTFIYSRRSGTRAESLPDPVPPKEKSQWLRELLAAQRGTGCAIMDSYVGSTLRVLVQETGHSNGVLTAHSSGSLIVEFPGDPVLSGQFVQVRVTSATNCVLTGELVV